MTTWEIETREAPGGILEVLDVDGIWRPVPDAAAKFIRDRAPKAAGFTFWEWWIGQIYAAGMFPPNGISSERRDADNADNKIVHDFMDAYRARFPGEVQKFAAYMGWRMKPMSKE